MKDYYLEDRTRLQGQPKKTIGDYVESQGILVPRRFDNLDDARKSKKAIILRSEHPQDYNGVSGLLSSPKLSGKYHSYRGIESLEEARERLFEHEATYSSLVYMQYCWLLGIDSQKFIDETSFSIWQYLQGINRFVSADSAVKERYHVLSFDPREGKYSARSYFILDNGKIEIKFNWRIQDNEDDVRRLVDDYKRIRNLGRFNSNHCPIMEFQTANGRNYFLQYHIGRDFEATTFNLDRSAEDGETELFFVRGATKPEGLYLKMAMVRGVWLAERGVQLPDNEDSALCNGKFAYDRIMFRRRKFQPFYTNDLELTYNKLSADHYARDSVFKPLISGIVDVEALISKEEHSRLCEMAKKTGQTQFKNFHLVSDGRRALIRRLEDE